DAGLAAQRGRHADPPGQVALDLALADERATAPARHPAHQAALLQHGQRLAQGRAADAKLRGQRALGPEPLPGAQPSRGDLVRQNAAHVLVRARGFGHQPSIAASDSGSTWPPSTTMVCPVMYPASSVARNSAAYPTSSTVPSRRSGIAAVMLAR